MTKRRNYTTLIGKKYGRLTVLEISGTDDHGRKIFKCLCDCGKNVERIAYSLLSGNTKSCGCLSRECITKGNNYKHGNAKSKNSTPEYRAWCGMIKRVESVNRAPAHPLITQLSELITMEITVSATVNGLMTLNRPEIREIIS